MPHFEVMVAIEAGATVKVIDCVFTPAVSNESEGKKEYIRPYLDVVSGLQRQRSR